MSRDTSSMNYELKPGVTRVMFSVDGANVISIEGPYSTKDPQIIGILEGNFANAVQRVPAPAKNNDPKDSK